MTIAHAEAAARAELKRIQARRRKLRERLEARMQASRDTVFSNSLPAVKVMSSPWRTDEHGNWSRSIWAD